MPLVSLQDPTINALDVLAQFFFIVVEIRKNTTNAAHAQLKSSACNASVDISLAPSLLSNSSGMCMVG